MNKNEEVKQFAIQINDLLNEYVKIHDSLFHFSWRRIFKPINFAELQTKASGILNLLERIKGGISAVLNEFLENDNELVVFLSQYCSALIITLKNLEELLHQRNLKSQNSGNYNFKKHTQLIKEYENSVSNYVSMGAKLNHLYSNFNK